MIIKELLQRYPVLTACEKKIRAAADALIACYEAGGKVLLCGNGGSCADCDHIVGELLKGFLKKRPLSAEKKAAMRARFPAIDARVLDRLQGGLPAVALPALDALNTAFCNDVDPDLLFAQPLFALAGAHDVLIGISTSGNAKNVALAAEVAKALGITVIGLTGKQGGTLRALADIAICAPETETFKVQELHLPIYHAICAAVESHFFDQ